MSEDIDEIRSMIEKLVELRNKDNKGEKIQSYYCTATDKLRVLLSQLIHYKKEDD